MPARPLSPPALADWIAGARLAAWVPTDVAVVDLDRADASRAPGAVHGGVAGVVVGTSVAGLDHAWASACDVVLAPGDHAVAAITTTVEQCPLAAFALVALLRGAPRDLDTGLVLESATYSALQAGPELAHWLGRHRRRERADGGDPVTVAREGATLRVTLDRPHVRNALDAAMREALLDALAVADADPALRVELRGAGPDFCAGGDLDEFGTFADPAAAHRLRLDRSVARTLARLGPRTTARLHGHCAGSGIELPAFAARVVADPGTQIVLPEVPIGLVPGAGGTVSLPTRIGRHRTALLALTAVPIDAATALAWGLVDEIAPSDQG